MGQQKILVILFSRITIQKVNCVYENNVVSYYTTFILEYIIFLLAIQHFIHLSNTALKDLLHNLLTYSHYTCNNREHVQCFVMSDF